MQIAEPRYFNCPDPVASGIQQLKAETDLMTRQPDRAVARSRAGKANPAGNAGLSNDCPALTRTRIKGGVEAARGSRTGTTAEVRLRKPQVQPQRKRPAHGAAGASRRDGRHHNCCTPEWTRCPAPYWNRWTDRPREVREQPPGDHDVPPDDRRCHRTPQLWRRSPLRARRMAW